MALQDTLGGWRLRQDNRFKVRQKGNWCSSARLLPSTKILDDVEKPPMFPDCDQLSFGRRNRLFDARYNIPCGKLQRRDCFRTIAAKEEPGKNATFKTPPRWPAVKIPVIRVFYTLYRLFLVFDFQDQISLGNCGKRKYPQGRTTSF